MKGVFHYYILLVLLLVTGCGHRINSVGHPSFSEDGILKPEIIEDFFTGVPSSKIGLYIEASGSMNGLYRANRPTAFKRCLSAILLDYEDNIPEVHTFIDGQSNIRSYSVDSFRDAMNTGRLVAASNTEVPSMLSRVLSDVNDSKCDVALFVSDMKYSPAGNGATAMDQYAIDISKLFKSYPNLVISVIGLESEYYRPNGTIATGQFPYYILVIGDKEHASYMRTMLLQTLDKAPDCSNWVKGCLDYNAVYGCPVYSVLPISGAMCMHQNINEILPGNRYYSFTGYTQDEVMKGEFVLAIRYHHIPYYIYKQLSDSDFTVSSYTNGAKAICSIISPPTLSSVEDKSVVSYVQPSIYLKVTIDSMLFVPDVLNVTLSTPSPDNSWVQNYFGATGEGDLEHTLSIDKFVAGLDAAYKLKPNYQDTPMMILVSNYE